jgi:ribonuclease BN (tRNA processing enzyme)
MTRLATGRRLAAAVLCLLFSAGPTLADSKLAVNKVKGALSVMVLGSGGPMATSSGRASAGYLIFTDGKPRILMDCGGGAFQRLAKSGADVKDLDTVLLSHLHIDHMSDLPAIIKTVYFHARAANVAGTMPGGHTNPIQIYGPAANGVGPFPASSDFVDSHFNNATGLERYLNSFATLIGGGEFHYSATNISPNWQEYNPSIWDDGHGVMITAVGVNHGPVPALAFRIDYKGHSIVYSGDTSSKAVDALGNPLPNGGNMVELARDADLLIYDTAITDDQPSALPGDALFFQLHTTPTRMGQVAAQAQVKKLLLSHLTPVTEPNLAEVKHRIRDQGFTGKIRAARDLMVIDLSQHDNDED